MPFLLTIILTYRTLCEHLRTNETFTIDQLILEFLHNYHQFSIKSYVVAIYKNRLGEAILIDGHNI